MALTLLLAAGPLHAAERLGELVTVEGLRTEAHLVRVADGKLEFLADNKKIDIPQDDLVRWGEPATPAAQPTALLSDGSVVVCGPAWADGGALSYHDGEWQIKNPRFRTLSVPRERVRAAWLAAAGEQPLLRSVRRESASYSEQGDRVWLTSGDTLSGELKTIGKQAVQFDVAGEAIDMPIERVAAIAVGGQREQPATPWVVGLPDGTLLRAESVERTGTKGVVTLAGGVQVEGRTGVQLCYLQHDSDRLRYLSDLEPLDYQHTPYLSVGWPLGRDAGGQGEALQAAGRRFLRGIAMHSASRVVYRVEGDWRRLAASLAVEDTGAEGSVTFHVLVAREGGFESAYDSPIVRSGDPPMPISVDIEGARAVALLVDFADYGDRGDHAVWLDARLER